MAGVLLQRPDCHVWIQTSKAWAGVQEESPIQYLNHWSHLHWWIPLKRRKQDGFSLTLVRTLALVVQNLHRPPSILSLYNMFSSAARIAARSAISYSSRAAVVAPSVSRVAVRSFASTFLPPAEVQERVLTVIKNFDKVDPSKVQPTSKFGDDLGLDSLDSVEVVMAIEDEFAIEIPDAEADRIAGVGDAVEYIAAHPMAK